MVSVDFVYDAADLILVSDTWRECHVGATETVVGRFTVNARDRHISDERETVRVCFGAYCNFIGT